MPAPSSFSSLGMGLWEVFCLLGPGPSAWTGWSGEGGRAGKAGRAGREGEKVKVKEEELEEDMLSGVW